MKMTKLIVSTLIGVSLLGLASGAHATLVATPAGPFQHLDDGYTAEIYSYDARASIGIAFDPSGRLLRTNGSGTLFVSSAVADTTIHGTNTLHSEVAHFIGYGLGYGISLGKDGFLYGVGSAGLLKIDPTTYAVTVVPGTVGNQFALNVLPNGKIVYGSGSLAYLYDPVAHTNAMIYNSIVGNDGLSVTADGYIVVSALGACRADIITETGTLVRSSTTSHCADGIVYGQGSIFKNNTDGTLTKLSFAGPAYTGAITETVVADGFGYGDWAFAGPDGALYALAERLKFGDGTVVDQAFSLVVRINAVEGPGFGENDVPEPFSLSLIGAGLLGLVASRRKKRQNA